jgi:hypothetical protein
MRTIQIQSHVKTALIYKLKYQTLCHKLTELDKEREQIRARLIQIRCQEKNIQKDKDNTFMAMAKEMEKIQ